MVLKFIIAGIAIIAFLGGGGLDFINSLIKKDEEEEIINGGDLNGSETVAILDDREVPTTPKEQKSIDKSNLIRIQMERSKAKKRDEEDIKKLEKRKEKRLMGRPQLIGLKKSGAEILREKRRQEEIAQQILIKGGATFGGTGKFGRPKLFGNPNFDLGLPSDATQADRDRVIRDRALRNAKRRELIIKRKQSREIQIGLVGKTSDELKEIARARGFAITGDISPKALSLIFQKRGIKL